MSRVSAMRRHAGIVIALAVAASLAVPILVGGRDALAQTLSLPAQAYLTLFGVIAVSWCARALKLHLLLRRLNLRPALRQTFAASLAIDFAFISTPAGVGGYAACLYYLRRTGASLGAATTITAADQILDLTFFALVLPLAGVLLLWSELPHGLAMLAFSTGAGMISAGVVALLARRHIGAWLLSDNALVRRWPALRRRQHIVREFLAGVEANTRLLMAGGVRTTIAIALLTAVQWLTRYGVLWTALVLLGHRVSYALTLLLQSLILHAAMWTGVPSGGGGAEIGLSAALSPWVPATDVATALLLWRLVTFDACLVVGVIAMLALARRRHAPPVETIDLAEAASASDAGG